MKKVVLKHKLRKWQSNHLFCLQQQQSMTPSLQGMSSNTAQVCKGILFTLREVGHENISESGILKGWLKVSGTTPGYSTEQASRKESVAQAIFHQLYAFQNTLFTAYQKLWRITSAAGSRSPQQQNCWGFLKDCLGATKNLLSAPTVSCGVKCGMVSWRSVVFP